VKEEFTTRAPRSKSCELGKEPYGEGGKKLWGQTQQGGSKRSCLAFPTKRGDYLSENTCRQERRVGKEPTSRLRLKEGRRKGGKRYPGTKDLEARGGWERRGKSVLRKQ